MAPVELTHTRSYPVEVQRAFELLLHFPLPELFDRRYAAIPPIKEVRDQAGAWGTPGQSRTIVLSDGGTMQEELLLVDPPTRFTYRISGVTGMMKPLVSAVDGSWEFEPAGTGTRVTWTWRLHPAGRLGVVAMPLFGRMWQGYARHAFDNIERLLLASAR